MTSVRLLCCFDGVEMFTLLALRQLQKQKVEERVMFVIFWDLNEKKIPVAAGADVSQGYYRYAELDYPSEERYWSEKIAPLPSTSDEAIQLLKQSIEQGATIICIGPFTNLYLLDIKYPGILKQANLFLMGGYIYPLVYTSRLQIIVCFVEGEGDQERITYEGKVYTRAEWEGWLAANGHEGGNTIVIRPETIRENSGYGS
jgi:hypothetical protein